MPYETKKSLLEVVDFAATKLDITSKGSLYLAIQAAIESHTKTQNDDWLEAAKPTLRIHRTLEACESCQG